MFKRVQIKGGYGFVNGEAANIKIISAASSVRVVGLSVNDKPIFESIMRAPWGMPFEQTVKRVEFHSDIDQTIEVWLGKTQLDFVQVTTVGASRLESNTVYAGGGKTKLLSANLRKMVRVKSSEDIVIGGIDVGASGYRLKKDVPEDLEFIGDLYCYRTPAYLKASGHEYLGALDSPTSTAVGGIVRGDYVFLSSQSSAHVSIDGGLNFFGFDGGQQWHFYEHDGEIYQLKSNVLNRVVLTQKPDGSPDVPVYVGIATGLLPSGLFVHQNAALTGNVQYRDDGKLYQGIGKGIDVWDLAAGALSRIDLTGLTSYVSLIYGAVLKSGLIIASDGTSYELINTKTGDVTKYTGFKGVRMSEDGLMLCAIQGSSTIKVSTDGVNWITASSSVTLNASKIRNLGPFWAIPFNRDLYIVEPETALQGSGVLKIFTYPAEAPIISELSRVGTDNKFFHVNASSQAEVALSRLGVAGNVTKAAVSMMEFIA